MGAAVVVVAGTVVVLEVDEDVVVDAGAAVLDEVLVVADELR